MDSFGAEPLIRLPHVRETHNQDGAVLLDPQRGQCYPLNSVAAFIWRQLGEGRTPTQIARNLATASDISVDLASADVQEFVRLLLDLGLISGRGTAETESPRYWRWIKGFLGRIRRPQTARCDAKSTR
jgi:hypothetical protein